MNGIVQGLSDEEVRKAAEWFAGLKPQVWTKVTEAAMVPRRSWAAAECDLQVRRAGWNPSGTASSLCLRINRE